MVRPITAAAVRSETVKACSTFTSAPASVAAATCSVGGADLGEWLVPSHRRYDAVQRVAEQAGRGMWKGSHVEPWLYRVCMRAGGKPADCSDDANAHP